MNNNTAVSNYGINLKKFQNIYNIVVRNYNINLKKNFNVAFSNYDISIHVLVLTLF